MSQNQKIFKIAAAQATPVFLNRKATVEKALNLIAQASHAGAELVVFPEGKEWINSGNSCIVNPKGEIIAGPVEMKEEIIYAEIDLNLVTDSKRMFDVAGHYARPDVFKFKVNREPNAI